MKKTILSALKLDESAAVSGIFAPKRLKNRLGEMGMTRGTKVTCILEAPFGGTKAYIIRGTRVAIGKEEAEKIFVVMENE